MERQLNYCHTEPACRRRPRVTRDGFVRQILGPPELIDLTLMRAPLQMLANDVPLLAPRKTNQKSLRVLVTGANASRRSKSTVEIPLMAGRQLPSYWSQRLPIALGESREIRQTPFGQ